MKAGLQRFTLDWKDQEEGETGAVWGSGAQITQWGNTTAREVGVICQMESIGTLEADCVRWKVSVPWRPMIRPGPTKGSMYWDNRVVQQTESSKRHNQSRV